MNQKDLDTLLSYLSGEPTSLEVCSMHKWFGKNEVLKGVNLKVIPGEMIVLIGGSGSGKTTLLRQIAGLDIPDEGKLLIDSTPLDESDATVSLVFQSSALFNSMDVTENSELFIREHGIIRNENRIRELSSSALSLVGLRGREYAMPSELSGGMRRRVAIARALLTNPDLLLFDEPTTGLDPVTKKSIEELILVIKREVGITQIVVTHDIRLAFSLADRLSIMNDGNIIQTGIPKEISASDNPVVRKLLSHEGKSEKELKEAD